MSGRGARAEVRVRAGMAGERVGSGVQRTQAAAQENAKIQEVPGMQVRG